MDQRALSGFCKKKSQAVLKSSLARSEDFANSSQLLRTNVVEAESYEKWPLEAVKILQIWRNLNLNERVCKSFTYLF